MNRVHWHMLMQSLLWWWENALYNHLPDSVVNVLFGSGIFAFKCSRAEEIFNLLQELMQCNSINVVEESMMMSRSGHTPEMDMSRTPQTPNSESHNHACSRKAVNLAEYGSL